MRFVASPPQAAVPVHDLGGGGEPLVMAHAAGFHGLVFSPLARELAGGFRCVSIDGRGHGDTALPRGVDPDWYGLAAGPHLGPLERPDVVAAAARRSFVEAAGGRAGR